MSWLVSPLNSVCDIQMGSAPSGSTYVDLGEGVPLIAGAADYGDITPNPKKATTEPTRLTKSGDIILCVRATIGDLNWADGEYCLGRGVAGLRAEKNKLDSKYLWYFLLSHNRELYKQANGSTFPQINREVIETIPVPLPPFATQQHIARVLEQADQLRKQAQQLESELNQLAQSLFIRHIRDTKNKTEFSFIDLAEPGRNSFVNGPFGSDLLTSELTTEGVPVVYIRDIRDGEYKRRSEVFVSKKKAEQLNFCNVVGGDVLIAKVGDPPGTAAVYPIDEAAAIVTQDVIRLRCNNERVLPEYLADYVNSSLGIHSFKAITVEATRSRIGLTDLKALKLLLPSIELQQKYVMLKKEILASRIRLRQQAVEFDDLFNSLMQRAFNGELTAPERKAA